MKAIKRIKPIKDNPLKFKEVIDEGWYKAGESEWNLLFLKNIDGILDVAIAIRKDKDSVQRVGHTHSWRDWDAKFVKLENFSVEI